MPSFINSLSRRVLTVALLVTAGTGMALAQNLNTKLPTDPNVETGKLANGLTYYIRTNHKPEKKVELRLVVKAGSILEDSLQLGLAHFMEHMNFNGTQNFQKNDLVSYLQSIGVEFGADLNAYTAFDQTVFILPIPTDKPGNLDKGFQIIEDWAHNALLTDKDIDEERNVVLEESRLGKGADMRMMDQYFPKMAEGSLYAERLPIGKDTILRHFKYNEIRRFYKDWYRPDLQAVAVVGDIDAATAKKMIEQHFASLKNPENERKRTYAEVHTRTRPEAMIVTDKEATNTVMQLMFPYSKKPDEITVGDYRKSIERNLALQMINLRLNDLAQSANPPFLFAGVSFDDLVHGYESFSAAMAFGSGGAGKAINGVTGELMRVKEYGFTEGELEQSKKILLSGIDKLYNERNTTDSKDYVEEYIRNFLNDEPFPGIANEYNYHKEYVPGITVTELNELVKTWLVNQNTFALITAPDKDKANLPTEQQLTTYVSNGFKQQLAKQETSIIATTLMAVMPKAGTLTSQKMEDGLDATTYVLSNGVKVTIKPTTFKTDEILIKGIKKGGFNNYGLTDRSNVHFATDVVESMGVGNFSPTDLEKVMAGKVVKVNAEISDINDAIDGTSTVNDFESMLQLINLYMTQPRKDEALFNAYKQKQQTMLQFLGSNPQVSFIDTTIKAMYNNNPMARMAIPKASDFDKLNLDRALEIYKNEFSDADGFHFFIVGNVKPETALPLIETYLGSISSSNKTLACKDNGVRPVSGNHELIYKKGTEKKSLIIAAYYGEVPYTEDFSLKAQAVAEVLNIKVIEDLREKLGGIYTGGFYATVSKEPYSRYTVGLQLPCGPENVDKLVSAAKEEITALKTNGPSATDLDKVKSQWREKYRTDVVENKYWTDKLENILFWDRDKNHVLQYEAWIDKLTPTDIQETAKILFNGNNQFVSILDPES